MIWEEIRMDIIKAIEQEQLKTDIPQIAIGDTVRVHIRIKEGNKERIQIFEGFVIARRSSGIRETITVRRISYGIGVEKVFPIHAPTIARIEKVRKNKARRAKLYYLRDRVGKSAKLRQKL
jgi:large subunit ribosomal protein L19